jgi:hypothetical protein
LLLRGLVEKLSSSEYRIVRCVIEQQYLDKGERKNVRTVIRTAQQAGKWEDGCIALGIPVVWVMASHWQAKMLRGLVNTVYGKSEARKKASKSLAKMKWGANLPTDAADATVLMAYQAEKEFLSETQWR